MSVVEIAVAEYVALRRSLGFKFFGPEQRLKGFLRFYGTAEGLGHHLSTRFGVGPRSRRISERNVSMTMRHKAMRV